MGIQHIFIIGCRKSSDNGFKEPKWNLIFQEDFNDSSLNSSAWSPYVSPGQEGNGLRRPEAFSLKDGNLVVTAARLQTFDKQDGSYVCRLGKDLLHREMTLSVPVRLIVQ